MKTRNVKKKVINKKGNNDEEIVNFLKEQIKKANKEIEKIENDVKLLNKGE
jgi:hypothetical protein